jgi:lysophospholipase L1-like esterase
MQMKIRRNKSIVLFILFAMFSGCNKNNPNYVKILLLGDSITAGVPYSYRSELYNNVSKRESKFVFVGSEKSNPAKDKGAWDKHHEGHSGWTTQDIDWAYDLLSESYSSDIALIHLGTNDILRQAAGQHDVDQSEQHMRNIIAKLRNDNAEIQIYLAQILPIIHPDLDLALTDSSVRAWNTVLAGLATELTTEASPIILVDMYSGFDATSFTDGIHPTKDTAKEMADRWASALVL